MTISRVKRVSALEAREAKAARDQLRLELVALTVALHQFLGGEATMGSITPMKMHLQVHAVAMVAIAERAISRLKRGKRGLAS